MSLLLVLVIFNVFLHGILAGVSTDVALVKLPTRKRIGAAAYANFARSNDLGNGLIVYPLLGIGALVFTFGTSVLAFFGVSSPVAMIPYYVACLFTIVHSLATAKAAPIMLSLRSLEDSEELLTLKMDNFSLWHGVRTVFQLLTFAAWIWALVKFANPILFIRNV